MIPDLLQEIQDRAEARGFALGRADIRKDCIDFKFGDETFSFSTRQVAGVVRCNGSFYEASINDLRRLEREAESG